MRLMINFDVGDIVVLEFPFSHLHGSKRRPGFVLVSEDADVLLARITTQAARHSSDIALVHWAAVGLPKASTVRLTKLAAIDRRLVNRRIGRLHPEDARAVAGALTQPCAVIAAGLQT